MTVIRQFSTDFGNGEISFEVGRLAGQANGALTVRWGDTVVLVAATAGEPRPGIDFFPLTVDVEERRYASGRIPGGFFRREGRPSTEGILVARSIDRPLRPMFPEGYRNDVQVVVMPLSSDDEHAMDVMSICGASAALIISDIPFETPVGAVRVGYVDGEFLINPTMSEVAESQLDMVLAGTADSVLMIEVGAKELPENLMMEAIRRGHDAIQGVCALQEQMRAEVGKAKKAGTLHVVDAAFQARVAELVAEPLREMVAAQLPREERQARENEIRSVALAQLESEELDVTDFGEAFEEVLKQIMRRRILDTGIRIDGRDTRTIRPLSCEVGLLPRTHGSALFNRGETQVLTIVTLGTSGDEQKIEWFTGDVTKRYMHHYNFPPYSTGEVGRLGSPRRREIGHGALAERAIEAVLPPAEEFPYTIRAVSEVMSSNGSTSMASTCASSLALFDAGVPLKAPVAGIAMGVITEGDEWAVLTDIQGLEDHLGDMDFKVTGTTEGITAIQLDIKIHGLRYDIIEETLARAREARLEILDVMNACLPEPRTELSPYAPRLTTLRIGVDKIGALIGPGGKNIRSIIEDTGVTIDVADDGVVTVGSTDGASANEALERIRALTIEPEVGEIYTGKVVRTTDFGAFVEILPGKDGLVHISQLADYHVANVEDVVKVGDEIMVMVTDVSREGKIRLSRQAVLEGWSAEEAREHDRPPSGPRRDSDRGGDRGRSDRGRDRGRR
ncbi:MAG: polyribonucleotide nucleotidyltransferase [Anaerolineales bacterium]